MISASARLEVAWIPTDRIVVEPDEVRSLDRVAFYVDKLRKAPSSRDSPGLVLVQPRTDGYHVAIDGVHRWLAHVLEGRTSVRCLIVREAGMGGDGSNGG
jgi:hypothetical protein